VVVFANKDLFPRSEIEVFLSQLLQYITQIFNSNINNTNTIILDPLGLGINSRATGTFVSGVSTSVLIGGYEPEAIEAFFTFIHRFLSIYLTRYYV
jgi:hypothetical protein